MRSNLASRITCLVFLTLHFSKVILSLHEHISTSMFFSSADLTLHKTKNLRKVPLAVGETS